MLCLLYHHNIPKVMRMEFLRGWELTWETVRSRIHNVKLVASRLLLETLGYSDGEQIDFVIHLGIIKTIADHVLQTTRLYK